MARLTVAAMFGVVVGVVAGAALNIKAQDLDDLALEVAQVANESGKDPVLIRGAVNAQQDAHPGLRPRAYMEAVGELAPPAPPRDALDRLIDCLEWAESRGVASAVNPRSGASGPLQFLPSTWRTTPQGKAGLSVFDRAAARAATRWMISVGRGREWVTWRLCA